MLLLSRLKNNSEIECFRLKFILSLIYMVQQKKFLIYIYIYDLHILIWGVMAMCMTSYNNAVSG